MFWILGLWKWISSILRVFLSKIERSQIKLLTVYLTIFLRNIKEQMRLYLYFQAGDSNLHEIAKLNIADVTWERLFVSRYQTPRDLNVSFALVYIFYTDRTWNQFVFEAKVACENWATINLSRLIFMLVLLWSWAAENMAAAKAQREIKSSNVLLFLVYRRAKSSVIIVFIPFLLRARPGVPTEYLTIHDTWQLSEQTLGFLLPVMAVRLLSNCHWEYQYQKFHS